MNKTQIAMIVRCRDALQTLHEDLCIIFADTLCSECPLKDLDFCRPFALEKADTALLKKLEEILEEHNTD